MIQHVRQLDHRGCGIACLAMLLGTTYEDAKQRLFGRRPPQDLAVEAAPINRELRRAGIGTKYDWVRRGYPCLVPLSWDKTLGHFVVWDPSQPKVYLCPNDGLVPISKPDYRAARALSARMAEPILLVKR